MRSAGISPKKLETGGGRPLLVVGTADLIPLAILVNMIFIDATKIGAKTNVAISMLAIRLGLIGSAV